MIWTEDMKETLRELAGENISYTNIAKQMSAIYSVTFTKGSVIGMAGRIGVPRRELAIIKKLVAKSITIYDLEWGMCKWPLGEAYDKPPFMYCGKATRNTGSWCPVHRKRAYSSDFRQRNASA